MKMNTVQPGVSRDLKLQQTLYTSRNPTRRWLHCGRRDWIVQVLRSQGESVPRALEVGPGSGEYLPTLMALADLVVATDIQWAYLSNARDKVGYAPSGYAPSGYAPSLVCVCDDISNSALVGGRFELILCTEVIEHLADSTTALNCLSGLLSAEGVLILTTPQRFSTLELVGRIALLPGIIWLIRKIYAEPVLPMGHINLLSAAQLRVQLDCAGLKIVQQHKCGFYLPLLAEFTGEWGTRLLKKLESRLQHSRWSGLLWTQCYVLKRKTSGA